MKLRLRLGAALLLTVLLVGASACGDGDDGDETSEPDDTQATTTTAEDDEAADESQDESEDDEAGDDDFTGEDSEDICEFAQEFQDADVFSGDTSDPDEMEAQIESLAVALERLNELAPDEIAADLSTTTAALEPLIDLYRQYDYDINAISQAAAEDPSLLEGFNDPNIEAASSHVDAYFANVCGIEG